MKLVKRGLFNHTDYKFEELTLFEEGKTKLTIQLNSGKIHKSSFLLSKI